MGRIAYPKTAAHRRGGFVVYYISFCESRGEAEGSLTTSKRDKERVTTRTEGEWNMPSIRTFADPVEDCVTVRIPKEYRMYSFEVVLVPFQRKEPEEDFLDFLRSCPVDLNELDLTRDPDDGHTREEVFV